ncbi:MAG: TIGR02921 family PEP-CTERM protein [Deltaproteobacteria bacterium]|nr:TIGR02921 family PEP-CTERM protein [Deltaproteobacteria bacterium]
MEQRALIVSPTRRYVGLALRGGAYAVVFGWSLLFLMLAYCLATPVLLIQTFTSAADAEVAGDFLLALGLSVVVASSSLLLLRRGVRSSPRKLLAFFYGFEAPMIVLVLLRLFLVREITAGAAFVLGCIVLGCFSAAWSVFRPYAQSKAGAHAQLAIAAVALVSALSLAAYYALYLPPAAAATLDAIFSASTWTRLWHQIVWSRGFAILWSVTGLFFVLISGSLFLGAPLGVVVAHVRHFRDQTRFHRLRFASPALTAAIVVASVALTVALWAAAGTQRSRDAFSRIEAHLKAPAPAELERLYRKEATLRAALLDAYLAPYRYLGARGETNHLQHLYKDTWFAGPIADAAQDAHDFILRPFLYDGDSLRGDQERAAALYATLFDAPIQRAEREKIDHAFASTYERLLEKAASSLVDIDAKRVRLERQDVSVREVGDASEVTIHDVYKNVTNAPQEILYYFELPEDAVVTGLWLGHNDNRDEAFAHRVAPRGAAQKVYKAEVRRRVDPALVEQVGPRQYRLRAYPVPTDKPLHVWMSYAAEPDGALIPRPRLLERRNAFFDGSTQYSKNGTAVEGVGDKEWVRVELKATASAVRGSVSLGGRTIERTPRDPCRWDCKLSAGKGERVAIVVDRSFSMPSFSAENELGWAKRGLSGYAIDLVLAAAEGSGRARIVQRLDDDADLRALGSSTFAELLDGDLGGYDAVFVLTDDDGYDRAADFNPRAWPKALWIVHSGAVPRAYPDAIADALSRRGSGIAGTLSDAVARWQSYEDPEVLTVSGKEAWKGTGKIDVKALSSAAAAPIDQIAAKMWIAARAERLAERDTLHALAQATNIVTPLSSMIVLVDERQHKALDDASKDGSKFDRAVEDGKEQAPAPGDPFNLSATPEPEEWMLLFAVLALIAYMRSPWRDRGRTLSS